jgi:putrescine transport system substrate-binding protein
MNMNLSYSKYLLGMAIITGLATVSCSKSDNTTTADAAKTTVAAAGEPEEKVLNIYNWSDYIAPDTVANF